MLLELISFKTCPFVQRTLISLNYKAVPYEITFIDLANPPEWFLELSPLGKVPVLKVDGEVLFESAVINEYVDDITGGELQPKAPLARAKNRAWIEYASDMLGTGYLMKMSKDKESYDKYRTKLLSQMHRIEHQLDESPWFNGDSFSLADTAFAPIFMHDAVADYRFSVIDFGSLPKVSAWSKRLLAMPAVQQSVVTDFEQLYLEAMKRSDSYCWKNSIS